VQTRSELNDTWSRDGGTSRRVYGTRAEATQAPGKLLMVGWAWSFRVHTQQVRALTKKKPARKRRPNCTKNIRCDAGAF